MASTYSNLKFELIGTGDQSGTWGTTTNTNLGTAIEQALVGMATISSGFVTNSLTLTLTDTNAAQNARALVLNLTQALSGAGTLNVPAIQKPYMIINATGQTVTVKVTGLTGVAVPNGTRAFLYNNGTDVGEFFNYHSSLTLGTALPVASGGTGSSTACGARTNLGLGTIATQAASNVSITGGSITGITDLAVADGGTGASSAPAARTNLGATTVGSNLFTLTNPSAITFLRINADNTVSTLDAATFRTAIGAGTGGGSVSCVNTSGSVNGLTLTGGPITTTGTVTLGGGVNVSTITTGTLPVARGGTGLCAVGSSGNVLTSNGTAWVSQAAGGGANIQSFPATGTYTKPSGAKFVMVELWSAGGSGGSSRGSRADRPNSGGGGGAYVYKMFAAPCVGATETVTVGAGGTGVATTNGSNGGSTNFGTLLYAYGGEGGGNPPSCSAGGAGAGGRVYGGGNCTGLQYKAFAPGIMLTGNAAQSYGATNIIGISKTITDGGNPTIVGALGIWTGGAGGGRSFIPPTTMTAGGISMFGGGGGGGGGNATVPAPAGSRGGRGNLWGNNASAQSPYVNNVCCRLQVGTGGGGAAGPPSGAGTNGTAFNGGGGTPISNPVGTGGNGGLAAGGGAAGQIVSCGNYCSAKHGNGGNGYAVVYTW